MRNLEKINKEIEEIKRKIIETQNKVDKCFEPSLYKYILERDIKISKFKIEKLEKEKSEYIRYINKRSFRFGIMDI